MNHLPFNHIIMRKQLLIMLMCVLTAGLVKAQTDSVDVTFQVDMSNETVDAAGVWIYAYNGDNYDDEYWLQMEDGDADMVYEITLKLPKGMNLWFNYYNGEETAEEVEVGCRYDPAWNDRYEEIGDADATLDVVPFGSCSDPAVTVNVTFLVDMSDETVSEDGVQVVIKNPWIWTAMTDAGGGIWEATVALNPNETYPYTYVNGAEDYWEGEEPVPVPCNYNTPTAPERHAVIAEQDTVLEAVKYGHCLGEVPVGDSIDVTFQVDMSGETVDAAGVFIYAYNNDNYDDEHWVQMMDSDVDMVYDATLKLPNGMGLWYNYYNGEETAEEVVDGCRYDVAWNDRYVEIPASDYTLPAVPFGGCADTISLVKVDVTFRVNMSMETVTGDGVQVVIKDPWIWTTMTDMGEGIWEATVNLIANERYPFTFVNGVQDAWDKEERIYGDCNFGGETNPQREVDILEEDVVLPAYYFGSCSDQPPVNPSVTFRVDMADETVSGDGVQVVLKEPWLWTAMTDAGDGIWEATIELEANTTYPYSYINGAVDYWAGEEVIVGDCRDGEENQRLVEVLGEDIELDAFVFGTCAERPSGLDLKGREQLLVYPNPAGHEVHISSPVGIQAVRIVDICGRQVVSDPVNLEQNVTIGLRDLDEGIYFMIISTETENTTQKLMINR
jgi:hypothetical protein